ncbi:DNA-binding response regulator [Corticibacter populi]|uniref:DNA-binding response regulator n=1 Tax=Corticibacter populi TaxID=1550736 RepID=A0A3M6QPL1_9BURK|nr:response regulator transcription factor [Corticibacter populi]RMX04342.1 DNA-binding response regulator [Corticibacter populi]
MKILIADDHRLVVDAVRGKLMELDAVMEFVLAATLQELRQVDLETLDLALVDLGMPGAQGLRHVGELRERSPSLPIIVLSGTADTALMRAALETGVLGFIPKAYSAEVMLSAIRLVLAGGVYVPPALLTAGPAGAPGTVAAGAAATGSGISIDRVRQMLTSRQIEVLGLLSQGKPNKLIGRSLGISEGTVKIHLAAIFRALNVRNRTEAVVVAQQLMAQQPAAQENGDAPSPPLHHGTSFPWA